MGWRGLVMVIKLAFGRRQDTQSQTRWAIPRSSVIEWYFSSMQPASESRSLQGRKVLATAAVVLWLATLALISGPARWEFAHTYAHWIEGAERDLPSLTRAIALPVLGLTDSTFSPTALLYLAAVWLWPLAALWFIWRAPSRTTLQEIMSFSIALYGTLVFLASALLALGLWLPFSLL